MFLWAYLFVILVLAVYAYLVRYYRQIILATKLPGPKAYPVIGNYNIIRANSGNYLRGSSIFRVYFNGKQNTREDQQKLFKTTTNYSLKGLL